MKDWVNRLDSILQLNGRELLINAGKISHEKAIEKSNGEYAKYQSLQKEIANEANLKEIENDINALKRNVNK